MSLRASLVAQMVKNLPAMKETLVRSLGREDSLEKGMATHSSIFVWRIPWTSSLAGYNPGLQELDMTEQLSLSLSLVEKDTDILFRGKKKN